MKPPLHITQHKRFANAHPNPALLRLGVEISRSSVKTSQELFNRVVENDNKCWASFMLEPLYDIARISREKNKRLCAHYMQPLRNVKAPIQSSVMEVSK
ncbi:MAG: hypothetical protein DRP61_05030 [Candidatus Omnitrophota bacterium]|nr:MAG: hypothetical protein DRP61_05030 [Candidatus Omnitrophota bacterium]